MLDDKTKETVKLNTELTPPAILFAGTAGGVSSLIIRGWSSAREVMVVAVGIISFIVLGMAFVNVFRNTENLLK